MGLLLKAAAAFSLAAFCLGIGPFSGAPDPHWGVVKADLAAARPQVRLAAQVHQLLDSGTPRPDTAPR